jgi:hypothetical protein
MLDEQPDKKDKKKNSLANRLLNLAEEQKKIDPVFKKKKANLELGQELDEQIEQIQRSTKTTFKQFVIAHNNLRMRFKWYYRWHLWKGASFIHLAVLVFYIIGISTSIFLFLTGKPAKATAAWMDASWAHRSQITIAHGKIGSGGTTNTPVLLTEANMPANLWTEALASGADLRMTASDGTTEINFELVTFTPGTPKMELWFLASSLSSSADTNFYLYWGNSGASAKAASWGQGVWTTAGYTAVYHLKEDRAAGDGTAIYTDSTGNNHAGLDYVSATGKDGIVGAGQNFTGGSTNDYINLPTIPSQTVWTVSCWFKRGTTDSQERQIWTNAPALSYGPGMTVAGSKLLMWDGTYIQGTTTLDSTSWYYGAYTRPSSGNKLLYVNGQQEASQAIGIYGMTAGTNTIGFNPADTARRWAGALDECRIASAVKSAANILTDYNSQSSPSTFYSMGGEENVPPITVSGTCKQYDESTNCANSETVKVAINGTLQSQTATTSSGSWSITGVAPPASGDTITVFVDGVADANEANAVTKYDGSGDITGINLFEKHLSLGSDDNQTLSNADIKKYDNSVSSDEDIFFEVDSSNNLTLPATSTQTDSDQKLIVKASNTWRPASAGGTTSTVPILSIPTSAIVTLDSNTLDLSGSGTPLAITGTFNCNTSTVKYTAAGDTTITATNYNNLETSPSADSGGGGGSWIVSGAGSSGWDGTYTLVGNDINSNPYYVYNNQAVVSGAGDTSYNGTYTYVGKDVNGNNYYVYHGGGGDRFLGVTDPNSGSWFLTSVDDHSDGYWDDSPAYYTNNTYDLTYSWSVAYGTYPAPSVTGGGFDHFIGKINTPLSPDNTWVLSFNDEHSGSYPWGGAEYYVGAAGVALPGGTWTSNGGSDPAPTVTESAGPGTAYTFASGTINVAGYYTNGDGTHLVTTTADTNDPTLAISGTFTNSASATFVASNSATFSVGGNWSNSGTFTHSVGTVTLNGGTGQTINGSSTTTFNALTVSNTAAAITVSTNMSAAGNLTLNSGAVLAPDAAVVISGSGTLTGYGTAKVSRTAATPDFLSQYTISGKTYTNLTIEYTAAAAQTVSAVAYSNLKISNTSSAVATMAGDTTVSGVVTISSGGTLSGSSHILTLSGSGTPFVVSGTFTPSTSTVIYTGSSATNVAATTYHNLTTNHSGTTFSLAGDITATGDFNNTAGTFNANSHDQHFQGNFTNGASSTYTKGGTLYFDGTLPGTYTDNNATKQNIGTVHQEKTNTTNSNNNMTLGSSMTVDRLWVSQADGQQNTFDLASSGYTLLIMGSGTGNDRPLAVDAAGMSGGTNSTIEYQSASATDLGTNVTYNNLKLNHSGNTFSPIAGGDVSVSGVFTITSGTIFDAGAQTITLSGSGTPFVKTGTFTASTSTFKYTGVGDTTITAANYNNLETSPSAEGSGDNLRVRGAGDSSYNGTYTLVGNDGYSYPYYVYHGGSGDRFLACEMDGAWVLTPVDGSATGGEDWRYVGGVDKAAYLEYTTWPPLGIWGANTGTSPAPVVEIPANSWFVGDINGVGTNAGDTSFDGLYTLAGNDGAGSPYFVYHGGSVGWTVSGAGNNHFDGTYRLVGNDANGNPYYVYHASGGDVWLGLQASPYHWVISGSDSHGAADPWANTSYQTYVGAIDTVLPGGTWVLGSGMGATNPAPTVTAGSGDRFLASTGPYGMWILTDQDHHITGGYDWTGSEPYIGPGSMSLSKTQDFGTHTGIAPGPTVALYGGVGVGYIYTFASGTINVAGYYTNGDGTHLVTTTADTNDPTLAITGTFTNSALATFVASNSGTFSIGGNYTNSGIFTDSSGTLTLNGAGAQTITAGGTDADHDFHNLIITNADSTNGVTFADSATVGGTFTNTTVSSKMTFHAGSTYALAAININGAAVGTRIQMRSSSNGTPYNFVVSGSTPTASYVDVKDSNATGSSAHINATTGGLDSTGNTYWDFPSSNSAPTNDSLTFTNPYVSNNLIADDTTSWDFQAKVTDADGSTDLSTVDIGFANSTDSTTPYNSLRYRWTRSSDTFSEVYDTQSAATITSTSSDSNASGNQWTLDFKIKFNSSFTTTNTNYAAELYSIDAAAASDTDNYASIYQVTALSLSLGVDYSTISFGNLLPGTAITGTTITTVTTNYPNGYSLSVYDGISGSNSALLHTDTITYILDYAGTIATPTIWTTGTGLGICVYSATNKDTSKWGTGTTETDGNNKYAGIPQTAATINSKIGSPTTGDNASIGYRLVVPNNQKTGYYSGTITYMATGVLN